MNTNPTDILRVTNFTRKTSKRTQSQWKCRARWFQVGSHGTELGHGRAAPITTCFSCSCSADNSVWCNYLSTAGFFWTTISFGKVLLQVCKIWVPGRLLRPELIGRHPIKNTEARTVAAKVGRMISLGTSQLLCPNEKSGPIFLCWE
jgi:hypothetical protein